MGEKNVIEKNMWEKNAPLIKLQDIVILNTPENTLDRIVAKRRRLTKRSLGLGMKKSAEADRKTKGSLLRKRYVIQRHTTLLSILRPKLMPTHWRSHMIDLISRYTARTPPWSTRKKGSMQCVSTEKNAQSCSILSHLTTWVRVAIMTIGTITTKMKLSALK